MRAEKTWQNRMLGDGTKRNQMCWGETPGPRCKYSPLWQQGRGDWGKGNPLSVISLYISSMFLRPVSREASDASSLLKAEQIPVVVDSVSIQSSASIKGQCKSPAHAPLCTPITHPTVNFSKPWEHEYWVHYFHCLLFYFYFFIKFFIGV